MEIAPFASLSEHLSYCQAAGVDFEDGAIGFKFFSNEEMLGLCQLKLVSGVAYLLNLTEIDNKISIESLANLFLIVVEFLRRVEISSVVFPIQREIDVPLAETIGFDKVSDTLYVFELAEEEEENHHCSCEDENCHCSH